MAIHVPITSAPNAHTFSPADWLHRFEAVGGAFTVSTDALNLFIRVHGNTYAHMACARRMIADLADAQFIDLGVYLLAEQAAKLGELGQ